MSSHSITAPFLAAELEQKEADSTAIEPVQVERLYMAHSEELKKYLTIRTHSEELAEVIMQDMYLRLMSIPDLSIINNPSAYLVRLANNLLIDHYRYQQRIQQRYHEQPVDEMEITGSCPSLPEQIHYEQLLAAYQQALSELPDTVQEIIRLFHIEGLSHQEIARNLGKSVSWIEKSTALALLHCRQKIDDIDY